MKHDPPTALSSSAAARPHRLPDDLLGRSLVLTSGEWCQASDARAGLLFEGCDAVRSGVWPGVRQLLAVRASCASCWMERAGVVCD